MLLKFPQSAVSRIQGLVLSSGKCGIHVFNTQHVSFLWIALVPSVHKDDSLLSCSVLAERA